MTDTNLNEETDFTSEASESASSEQKLWPSAGQKLKKLREELGYSREKVAQSLYITVHYVEALEHDNYAKLPGHPFVKGYYKAYANFLGADTDQLLNYYLNHVENSINQGVQETQTVEPGNRNKSILWIAVVIVLIGALAGAFLMMNDANALSSLVDVIDE
ncbi:helix-turn-helix domain-containing protein [Haliea sp. AH-315-K21]|uniref:HTH cro/C1-type domain-containing protein n=1 Tax=SAR86 cluster bacterium TaxID=2030880 RepID=A0A2A5CBE4_9GAMM|nr:helix-turn-helix domain-containing protein [Haliea sp. AH-315-K21]PCJ41147.1 MAG: hypothetical protein COA71_08865 [SAR86 cluster bacterium]